MRGGGGSLLGVYWEQELVGQLKTDVHRTRVCAAMRNPALHKQWHANTRLTHTLRALQAVHAAAQVPPR